MPDFNFDPKAALDSYREALAPTLRAQQEALKTIERFGRYHYAVAGDYLEWGLAQAKASLASSTPAELAGSQTTLATQFGEKFKARIQELASLTAESQSSFNQLFGEATAKAADTIKAKVAETTAKVSETTSKMADSVKKAS